MAPPSPRRSARARPTGTVQSQQSSGSSGASARPERSTRSTGQKSNSSGKSTPSASLSSEPPEDFEDTLLGRRRKRNQEDDHQDKTARSDHFNNTTTASDDPQDEEDEAVRCICGSEDYPGPPPADAPDAEFFLQHELTEDVTGFFVQCDVCKVWQHGACVGIFSAESSPEEYFCELCRKEFHKIHTAGSGQRYSRYQPTARSSRALSRQVSTMKDDSKPPRSGGRHSRNNSSSHLSKRRSTMNSRDAAYDDEILRRAIEASKDEPGQETIPENLQRAKRSRSDSEEHVAPTKRLRTDSRSTSPVVEATETASREDSEDSESREAKLTRSSRPQRDKLDRDDREKSRQEATQKRKGRAERRRAEDSEAPEETSIPASKAATAASKSIEPPIITESSPPTPTPAENMDAPGTPPQPTTAASSTHKRVRSQNKKGKGRNQYTREKEGEQEESPARSMSRDIQKSEDPTSAPPKASTTDHPKTKAKSSALNKLNMVDMKRRVGAIMDFISRTQVDLAAEGSPTVSDDQTPQKGTASSASNGGSTAKMEEDALAASSNRDFKDLTCMEMMDVLTRDMVKWQNSYAL